MDALRTPDQMFVGAAGQPHARINASHFIQEDAGPELAERILSWNP